MSQEFQTFCDAPETTPPDAVSRGVQERVYSALNPSLWSVLGRLSFIHLFSGMATLVVCPQFGLSWSGGEHTALMMLFMRLGEYGCMVACGGFFLGTSTLAASVILSPEQVRSIRKHPLLQLSGLAFASLGTLFCLGGVIVIPLALAWFFGSVFVGTLSLELGWKLRWAGTLPTKS